MPQLLYFITPKELSIKLKSTSKLVLSGAILEQFVCENSQHKPTYLPHYSKFTKQNEIIWVSKGEYFTTYGSLAHKLSISIKQVRNRLKSLATSGLVEVENVKDDYNFDLGIKIRYLPIFDMFTKGNRKKPINKNKSRFQKPKEASINKKVLSKDKQTVVLNNYSIKTLASLVKMGMSQNIISQICRKYHQDEVLDYLKLLELSKKVTNPIAWIQSALTQKYDLSKVKYWKKEIKICLKKEQKRQSEEEILEKQNIQLALEKKRKEYKINEWKTQNQEDLQKVVITTLHQLKSSNMIIYNSLTSKANLQSLDLINYVLNNSFFNGLINDIIYHKIEANYPSLI